MFFHTGVFLIQTLFDLYIYVVMLRFLLQAIHADYYNPLSQFAIKFTQPIIRPLQKILPDIKGIDLAVLFLLVVLEALKLIVLILFELHTFPRIIGLVLFTCSSLIHKFLMFYFYAIIIRVVLSFVPKAHHHPAYFALIQLTDPLVKPLRRLIPPIAGFDLSPVIVIIVLQILTLLLSDSLLRIATELLV